MTPRHRSLLLIATVAAVAGLALLTGPYRLTSPSPIELSAFSIDERTHISELMLNVAESPHDTLPTAREHLWTTLHSHGELSAGGRRELEAILLKIGQGPRLFWTDARQALNERRPVKSSARTQWEAELMGEGWLTLEQQRRYDDFMERIAREAPIESSHGVEIDVDGRMADAIVESFDDAELRDAVAALLAPP